MFKLYNIFIVLLAFWILPLSAQSQSQKQDTSLVRYYTIEPDSAICIHLNDVVVSPKDFVLAPGDKKVPRKYRKGTRAYSRTIRNLKVVYPIAKKAAKKIENIERQLQSIQSEKEKKAFVKQEYKKLMKVYKAPMKDLKISQGRMLMVLVHRETGNTSYEHIKKYKGGVTAFFWQGIARLFGNDLKKGYDPYGEHIYLEALIRRYEKGQL